MTENAAPDDSRELIRLVNDCSAASIGRSVLVLRLSLLPRERAQPHHLRLAVSAVEPMRGADRARRFELRNHDVVWVWRGEAEAAVRTCRQAVGHLCADEADPPDRSPDPEMLLRRLSLPADADDLLEIVEASLAPGPAAAATDHTAPPLDLGRLSALEAALQQADLARFARRRPVISVGGGHSDPAIAWEKRFFSIEELSAELLPDRSATADPWLFCRLTRTLDRRMLALLSHPEELRDARRFSLNLNVGSILAPEFIRFDEALPARLRGEVLIELLPADVVADTAAYAFARELARMRGYSLVLRRLTPMLLRLFARDLPLVDWLELLWSPELPHHADPLGGADAAKVVLGHADTHAAVAWARMRGIGHVHGRAAHPD